MLHQLPVELVRRVVVLALPPSSPFSSAYFERQDTLRALCLTSHLLKNVAQPLLLEEVHLYSGEALTAFHDAVAKPELGKAVRKMVLQFEDVEDDPYSENGDLPSVIGTADYRLLGRNCPSCQCLEIRQVPGDHIDFSWLNEFSSLRDLFVNGDFTAREPFSFPALRTLSITRAHISGSTELSIFNPASFPALRALALPSCGNFKRLPACVLAMYRPSAPIPLLPQLQYLCCDGKHLKDVDQAVRASPFLLVDFSFEDHIYNFAGLRDVRHIRFHHHDCLAELWQQEDDSIRYPFRYMLDAARHAPSLETMYLPFELEKPLDGTLTSEELTVFAEVLAACESRGIEVVYEEYDISTFISPHFWARCKALQEAEAVEKGEQA
ncbi:hypothetical protein JCM10213_003897 [Rhodosporidiobolus nylandii]